MSTESKYQVDGRSEADCFPEVDPGIDLKGNRIVVQLRKAKDVSKGGIILVGDTKATEKWNEVIAKVIAFSKGMREKLHQFFGPSKYMILTKRI